MGKTPSPKDLEIAEQVVAEIPPSELIKHQFDLAAACARKMVTPYLTDDTSGIPFPMNGRKRRIARDSPKAVQDAADFFCLMRQCMMRDSNDIRNLTQDWFYLGHLAACVTLSHDLGRRVQDIIQGKINSTVGLKKPSKAELRLQAEQAIEAAKLEHPDRAGDINFIKEVAAKSLDMTKRGLNERLRK